MLREIIEAYTRSESWQTVEAALRSGRRHIYVSGTTSVGKQLLLSCLPASAAPILFVTASGLQAEQMSEGLAAFFSPEEVALFPADELLLLGTYARSPELAARRLSLLSQIVSGRAPRIIVAPWDALLMTLAAPQDYRAALRRIEVGQRLDREELMASLVQGGYQRLELIEAPGQFAVRGALVDIYPLDSAHPVRIDFFGDEVDSLRSFDVTTQRATGNLEAAVISPASEVFWPAADFAAGVDKITERYERLLKDLSTERREAYGRNVGKDLLSLREGLHLPGLVRYSPYFSSRSYTLLDYLPEHSLVAIDEPTRVLERAEASEQSLNEQYKDLLLAGHILPDTPPAFPLFESVLHGLERHHTLLLATLTKRPSRFRVDEQIPVLHRAPAHYFGQMDILRRDLARLSQSNYHSILVASERRRQDILASLEQAEINVRLWDLANGFPPPGILGIVTGELGEGLDLPEARLLILTENEFATRARRKKRVSWQGAGNEAARVGSLRDLNVGDFVVHVNHGIGKYSGIRTMAVDGVQRDYIEIRYSGEDKLYVPTEQLHLVQKYIGAEGREPRLHSLGGSDWAKTKARVKESVEDMARELIALYATREDEAGYAFGPDSPWQAEMEYNFAFRETPDQLRAVDEVKQDMELGKPMDRLLCGDVGYGKTEVAVRAAFKAVLEGKQVAVLVPTTILAQQHFNTFRERFAGFPVEIGLMSRFRSQKDNQATAERLREGTIDVVIGTHRLLSADVRWKDLGLLIIDEEQRFGVKDKEKIKMLRSSVDVLTLTATPIPRTLHMAMIGLRDVSVIETPPEDRYPVQTMVVEHSDLMVKQAIERELERGGQVYYVHNRVRTIRSVAQCLQRLVPEARIAVGHGRMSEDNLERIFLDFLEGEYDVLLSTTIIESGLDIPNVNTIIVEDADRLGLAQLYQLRGRVGRSTRVGYAIFTFKPDKIVSEVADKRLSAVREFTQLGAGFKIAMRDLEIRGAGNLLGAEQHGFVASVGFDLYCQLLAEAVQEQRGRKPEVKPEVEIKLAIDAYFPSRYIRDPRLKVEMYKRVAGATSVAEIEDILDELLDRYGTMPDPVANLLQVARLRILARDLGVTVISQQDKGILCRLSPLANLTPDAVLRAYGTYPELSVQQSRGFALLWKTAEGDPTAALPRLIAALSALLPDEAPEEPANPKGSD